MPKNYSLSTLTSDILREVEEGQAMQKTAAELSPEYKSEIAQQVAKLAQSLRLSAETGDVSYDDLDAFLEKEAGIREYGRLGRRYLGAKIKNVVEKWKLKDIDLQDKIKAKTKETKELSPFKARKAQIQSQKQESEKFKVKPWHVAVGVPAAAGVAGGAYYLGKKLGEK